MSVSFAEGLKCERCWKYCTTVGDTPEYPDVCTTCADSLKLMGFKYFPKGEPEAAVAGSGYAD